MKSVLKPEICFTIGFYELEFSFSIVMWIGISACGLGGGLRNLPRNNTDYDRNGLVWVTHESFSML